MPICLAAVLVCVVCAIFCTVKGQAAAEFVNHISNRALSYVINGLDVANSKQSIPTCPYTWPDGQGNRAKFLSGSENSAIWRQIYGNAYRIWNGTKPEIVVSQSADVRTVYRDSHQHTKVIGKNQGRIMQELMGDCLGLIQHEPYKNLRASLDQPFSSAESLSYIPMISEEIKAHFEAAHLAPERNLLSQGKINPISDFKYMAFWIIARLMFGEMDASSRAALELLIPLREDLFLHMFEGGISRYSWSKFLPLQVNRDLIQWDMGWRDFIGQIVSKAPYSLTSRMQCRVDSGEITEKQFLQTIDELLFANLDVTSGAIAWNLVFLAAYPDIQAQLRTEIAQQKSEEGFKQYLRAEATLIHCFTLESARLRPLAPFSMQQSPTTARVVGATETHGGYKIPPGTAFTVDTHTLNCRQEFWGKTDRERYEFRPVRFLNANRAEIRYNYWRFGFGPRQCLGKHVADVLIKLLLIHLLEGYDLSIPGGEKEQDWKRDPSAWLTHPDIILNCTQRSDCQ